MHSWHDRSSISSKHIHAYNSRRRSASKSPRNRKCRVNTALTSLCSRCTRPGSAVSPPRRSGGSHRNAGVKGSRRRDRPSGKRCEAGCMPCCSSPTVRLMRQTSRCCFDEAAKHVSVVSSMSCLSATHGQACAPLHRRLRTRNLPQGAFAGIHNSKAPTPALCESASVAGLERAVRSDGHVAAVDELLASSVTFSSPPS